MTKGQNLKLKRRATAKGSHESRRQRNQRRRSRESKEERQPSIYQQLRGLREPQSGARCLWAKFMPGGVRLLAVLGAGGVWVSAGRGANLELALGRGEAHLCVLCVLVSDRGRVIDFEA